MITEAATWSGVARMRVCARGARGAWRCGGGCVEAAPFNVWRSMRPGRQLPASQLHDTSIVYEVLRQSGELLLPLHHLRDGLQKVLLTDALAPRTNSEHARLRCAE